jgi:hypothetical protein
MRQCDRDHWSCSMRSIGSRPSESQRPSRDSAALIPKGSRGVVLVKTDFLIDRAISIPYAHCVGSPTNALSPCGTLIEGAAVFIGPSSIGCGATVRGRWHRGRAASVASMRRRTSRSQRRDTAGIQESRLPTHSDRPRFDALKAHSCQPGNSPRTIQGGHGSDLWRDRICGKPCSTEGLAVN